MSRYVTGGTGNYLSNPNAVVTDYPFTVSYWVKMATHTSAQTHFYVGDQGGNTDYFYVGTDTSGNPTINARNSGTNTQTSHTSAMSDGTWYNVIAVFASSTDRRIYLNADSGTQSTTATTAGTGFDVTTIGRLDRASLAFPADARFAHMAVWNTALGSTDRTALAGGSSPQNVSVGSLINYWPLAGSTSPEPDSVGGKSMSITGTVADGASSPTVATATTRTITADAIIESRTNVQKDYSGRITKDDGSSLYFDPGSVYEKWTTTNAVTKSISSGEYKLASTTTSTDNVKRAIVDSTTKGDNVLGLIDAVVCFDLHGASANNGSFYATLYQDATPHSYGLVVAASDGGTSATQKNGSNLQTISVGVGNGTTRRCKFYAAAGKVGGKIDTTSFTESTDSANAGPFELRLGAPNNGSGTSDWRIDNLDVSVSNFITVRGVPTGGTVRLYDSGGSTLASASESSGTATLDCSSIAFPITGYLQVFTDSYTTSATLGRYPGAGNASDIRGGDRYVYETSLSTAAYNVVSPEFIAQYATTQSDSHNGAITNSTTGVSYGIAYGPSGSVLAWWGDRTKGNFQTYEIEPAGTITDQHFGAAIQVDSAGYFHIAYGPDVTYRKSSSAWAVNAWGSATNVSSTTGAEDYGLLIDESDNLYLIGNYPYASAGNSIVYRKKTAAGAWGSKTTIATADASWYFMLGDVAVGKEGSGQKSVFGSFFATNGSSYRDCIVIRSTDGGTNWKGISGSNFSLPLTTTSGVISNSNALAYSGTNGYVSRLCVDSNGTNVHVAMWDLGAGYPKYIKGTIGTGWAAPSANFTAANTHGAMEQVGSTLVYVTAGPSNNAVKRYSSTDTGASWSAAETMVTGVPSGSPPQYYWPKLTPVTGSSSVLTLWQSRYTTYKSGSSNVTGEGVASLLLTPVSVPVSRTFTADALIRGIRTFTADGIIAERLTRTFTADALIASPVALTYTRDFTADAVVVDPTVTRTITADAIVLARTTTSITADAVIVATITVTQRTRSIGADAIVIAAGTASLTTRIGYWLSRRRSKMETKKSYFKLLNTGTTRTTSYNSGALEADVEPGVVVFLDVTAASGTGGLTVRINAVDGASGQHIALNTAPTAVTSTGQYSYAVYPFGAISGNLTQSTSGYLPTQFSISVAAGDSSSYTYSLGYCLLP